MASHAAHARSLYRRLLRELPSRNPSLLANPSPVQHQIRTSFGPAADTNANAIEAGKSLPVRLQEAEQFAHYLKAQRTYTTLLERYNPGMNMDEEERVRLTGRRVGMEMPVEFIKDAGRKDK